MTVNKLSLPAKENAVQLKINEIIDNLGGGGTDVQINGTSITSNNVANIKTNGTYNATSNKIATMSDLPTIDSALSSTSTKPVQNKVINSALAGKYDASNPNGYTSNVGTVTKVNNTSPDSSGNVTITIPDAQVQSNWTETNTSSKAYIKNKPNLSTVATSGSYNDLSNKPTIPTVNNATLTIQKNGTTVKTFTANASSNVTCNITVPTKTSDITNDSGYTTNTGTVTSVNNVSPVNGNVTLTIPSEVTESTVSGWGFTKNTGTVTSVNNVSPVNGNVSLSIPTVPTNISAFNNDSGYITGINSTDVTSALGYAPANVTLSNLGATSSTNIDGQFIQKYLQLDNHTSKGSWGYNLGHTDVVVDGTTYSARNYLPDNNYIYVVYGQLEVVSVNDTHYYVGTGKGPYSNPSNMFFAYGRTHSNGNRQENFFCFPIVPNASGYQFIYDQIAVNTASTGARTTLIGYRRVGTNS